MKKVQMSSDSRPPKRIPQSLVLAELFGSHENIICVHSDSFGQSIQIVHSDSPSRQSVRIVHPDSPAFSSSVRNLETAKNAWRPYNTFLKIIFEKIKGQMILPICIGKCIFQRVKLTLKLHLMQKLKLKCIKSEAYLCILVSPFSIRYNFSINFTLQEITYCIVYLLQLHTYLQLLECCRELRG